MSHPIRAAAALVLALSLAGRPARAQQDAPFVTTPDHVTLAMLNLAQVGPADYVIDLGSGDGRIVILAAKQFGARGVGVEVVPDLVKQSVENAARAGVAGRAEFRQQSFFDTDLAKASVVTLHLLPEANLQLRPRLLALRPGTRIVSRDSDMADWSPDRSITLDAPDEKTGLPRKSTLYLWIVPARIDGAWCGTGKLRGATLQVDRKFQQFRATLTKGTSMQAFDGRIEGALARSVDRDLTLDTAGERLRTRDARAQFAVLRGAVFERRPRDTCK